MRMDTISLHDPEPYEGYEDDLIYNKMRVQVCDITKLRCDCIVNASNPSLLGGGGVDGAIHRAAGPLLREECRRLGGCKTGEAKITKGYHLPAKYVIHTVGPIYSGQGMDRVYLRLCYRNTLNLARAYNIHSIAFPAISTGAYRYPVNEATWNAVQAVFAWLKDNADYDMEVTFACFDQETAAIYRIWTRKNWAQI